MTEVRNQAENWIRFLRKYGPTAANENMYDELIQRSAQRARVDPILFDHPTQSDVLSAFERGEPPTAIVLTGTAGDGKTFLCRQVWEELGGDPSEWATDEAYLTTVISRPGARDFLLHVIRDLSAWAPQRGHEWDPAAQSVLHQLSEGLFDQSDSDVFLVAANDGQLLESWRRLEPTDATLRALETFEQLLVSGRRQLDGASLLLLNLSQCSSAELFDHVSGALLGHPGWQSCYELGALEGEFFGRDCPIRRNYEILSDSLVRGRIRALLALCDNSRLHVPIRQILLLLTNAILGHPAARDRLMRPQDVGPILSEGTASKASAYGNLFGANLPETRKGPGSVFDYLDRFRIGHETSNRIDNMLIFGEADDSLRADFDRLVANDKVYGASPDYRAAQHEYVGGDIEDGERATLFLNDLVQQRRRLFFTMPEALKDEYRLWDLTVFRFAGEYLGDVLGALESGTAVPRPVLARLTRGLNRIFTGMLMSGDRELVLATSPVSSHARISTLFEEAISVDPRAYEGVEIAYTPGGVPTLVVTLHADIKAEFPLYLTRYEFLSRVAEGALPSSFSKECYEDILSFKSRLLSKLRQRRAALGETIPRLHFRLLDVDSSGQHSIKVLEVRDA